MYKALHLLYIWLHFFTYHPHLVCIYFVCHPFLLMIFTFLMSFDDYVPSHMIVHYLCVIVYIGNEELQSIASAIGGLLLALEQTETK